MVKAIICDLDGSLMPPSSGLYVSEDVKNALIKVQEKGILVILNSARVFQGVHPLAKQIGMDRFGGFIISSNGCHVYDALKQETVFEYSIEKEMALSMWKDCLALDVSPGIAQPDYMISYSYTLGYELDHYNCDLDYIVTAHPERFVSVGAYKFCFSEAQGKLDVCFDQVKDSLSKYPVKVYHSTPTMCDVVHEESDKFVSTDRLLKLLSIDWQDVSYIGDSLNDLECIERAGLGVSLENAKEACKKAAKLIVPSCQEDGCLVWLEGLLNENH